jgi:hypothetical protein
MANLEQELEKLHDAGTSCSLGWLWDGGIDVTIGKHEHHVQTTQDVAVLAYAAVRQEGNVKEIWNQSTFQSELQKIYDSEFHVDIDWTGREPITLNLDLDAVKGTVENVSDILPWLQHAIAEHYPDSQYHVERMGGTFVPKYVEA